MSVVSQRLKMCWLCRILSSTCDATKALLTEGRKRLFRIYQWLERAFHYIRVALGSNFDNVSTVNISVSGFTIVKYNQWLDFRVFLPCFRRHVLFFPGFVCSLVTKAMYPSQASSTVANPKWLPTWTQQLRRQVKFIFSCCLKAPISPEFLLKCFFKHRKFYLWREEHSVYHWSWSLQA